MRDDPSEEVRSIRRSLSQRFDFDVRRICADALKKQQSSGRSYVPAPESGSPDRVASGQHASAEPGLAADGAARRS